MPFLLQDGRPDKIKTFRFRVLIGIRPSIDSFVKMQTLIRL